MNVTNIMEVLSKLEAPKSNLGYKYLIESLLLISEDEAYLGKITALYVAIGNRCNSTSARVERALRHEIKLIFNNESPAINEVLGTYRKHNNKIPNKEFITSLYYYLSYSGREK